MYCADYTHLCPGTCSMARKTDELLRSNIRREDVEFKAFAGTADCPMRRRKEKPDAAKGGTLCWTCANATSKYKCPWAGGIPRTDWVATPTKIHTDTIGTSDDRCLESYNVIECGGYIRDERRDLDGCEK